MSTNTPPKKKAIATRSVRAGLESDAQHGSVVPPIYLSTNFAFEKYGKPRKYDYTRSGNPTRDQLSKALADLEGGAGAVVTCTGLAAISGHSMWMIALSVPLAIVITHCCDVLHPPAIANSAIPFSISIPSSSFLLLATVGGLILGVAALLVRKSRAGRC